MPGREHEDLLTKGIEALKTAGLRVIRLDKRIYPDAIAVDFENRKLLAVEADTSPTSIWLTRKGYDGNSDFDQAVTVTRPLASKRYKSQEAYRLALKLKREGSTFHAIQTTIQQETGEHVSIGQLHDWTHGKSRPIT